MTFYLKKSVNKLFWMIFKLMCGVLGCAISNINKNILKKDEVK